METVVLYEVSGFEWALAIFIGVMAILGMVFTPIAIFLGKELVKKFHDLHLFARSSKLKHEWIHPGTESPGMRNIAIFCNEPFRALICFKLKLPWLPIGLDWYGMVKSNQACVAVFSTFLGRGVCHFRFLVNTSADVQISADDMAQKLTPTATFPPHWWQRLGIYG